MTLLFFLLSLNVVALSNPLNNQSNASSLLIGFSNNQSNAFFIRQIENSFYGNQSKGLIISQVSFHWSVYLWINWKGLACETLCFSKERGVDQGEEGVEKKRKEKKGKEKKRKEKKRKEKKRKEKKRKENKRKEKKTKEKKTKEKKTKEKNEIEKNRKEGKKGV